MKHVTILIFEMHTYWIVFQISEDTRATLFKFCPYLVSTKYDFNLVFCCNPHLDIDKSG